MFSHKAAYNVTYFNRVFHSGTSDRRVRCSRVWLEVKIYDTPAGGIRDSQGTFSSLNL